MMGRVTRVRESRWARFAVVAGAPAALALAVGMATPSGEAATAAAEVQGAGFAHRPNVVVVMTDDQRASDLEPMRKTRRFVAGQGATFRNFYATFPLCCPSRATFLTGVYAHNHGIFDNEPPFGYQAFQDERRTLPTAMDNADYKTGYIGKYLNGYGKDGTEQDIPFGWDDWQGITDGGAFDYTLNENGTIVRYGDHDPSTDRPQDYQTDVFADKATRFIRQNAPRAAPFFLTMAPQAPHAATEDPVEPAPRHEGDFASEPFPKPPSFNEVKVNDKPSFVRNEPLLTAEQERDMKDKYRARLEALLAVDEAVGRIVNTLKNQGELQNTLVIVTSDNGWMLGEHRLQKKERLYEESARVPLLMRGPGIPRDVRRGQIAGNIDLAPTILDVANAEHPRPTDGRSLIPLAKDADTGALRSILIETGLSGAEPGKSIAVRSPSHLYAEHRTGTGTDTEYELYNMNFDPYQLKSRHVGGPFETSGSASVQQNLRQDLLRLEDCAGNNCRGG
jgi:N-acetylglucosamine-6-sulfatase